MSPTPSCQLVMTYSLRKRICFVTWLPAFSRLCCLCFWLTVCTSLCAQVKVLAAALGMEALVVLCGVMNSKAAATRTGEEHICFNKDTPFISQLGVPGFGEDSGLSIGVVAAGTGGPLTAALDKPAQGSQAANMCLEYLAGQACMLHHQRLQVSGSGRAVWFCNTCAKCTLFFGV